jgi:SRSO17 transposase
MPTPPGSAPPGSSSASPPGTTPPLRQELLRWVASELGSDDGTLIFDESSFPKCGTKSVGVARQYCGTLGKVANCQVAAYVAYAGQGGHTLLDTRLYLPEEWTDDPDRCRAAGVPEGTIFRTKPQLAFELLLSVPEHLRHSWPAFDEVYGRAPAFLDGWEELGERYIGEVPKDTRVWLKRAAVQEPGRGGGRGAPRKKPRVAAGEPPPQTVAEVAASLPATAWRRLAFRKGSKGTQYAEFARVRVIAERDDLPGPELWLVIQRGCAQQTEAKYYLSKAAPDCPLVVLAEGGHRRWPVEDCFLRGKDELGLGDYEVQGWRGWQHHQTLVLLALWFLVLQQRRLGKKSVAGMTLPDTRRLLQAVFAVAAPRHPEAHAIALSDWRQARNEIARQCHAKTHEREQKKARRQGLGDTG